MLTLAALVRGFRQRDIARLLRGLEAGGLPLPHTLRPSLRHRPVAVLALAARRAAELAYGPRPELHDLADALLAHQRPDGGFDGEARDPLETSAQTPREADPLTTAAAVSALDRLAQAFPPAHAAPLEAAADRAGNALARLMPALDSAVSDARATHAATPLAAMIAFLLSDTPRRAHLMSPAQLRELDRACHGATDATIATLWRMARLGLPIDSPSDSAAACAPPRAPHLVA